MSQLVDWMINIYTLAKMDKLDWHPVYPNNMICNSKVGIYTDMNVERNGKYQYIKYTIEYQSRCDENGMSHPSEGTKFYILHSLVIDDMDEPFIVPEPSDQLLFNNENHCSVNNYGRFRYAFDDLHTAKKVVSNELIQMIYPYFYVLCEEEQKKWNEFIQSM